MMCSGHRVRAFGRFGCAIRGICEKGVDPEAVITVSTMVRPSDSSRFAGPGSRPHRRVMQSRFPALHTAPQTAAEKGEEK